MTRLPDFLVGGAPKCGTSSLAKTLGAHPEVFVPAAQEVPYFHCANYEEKGASWYASHFKKAGHAQRCGETTPDYLADVASADRIARDLPAVKLIFMVRDPIARAHSHYWHRQRSQREPRSFPQAVRDEMRSASNEERGYLLKHGRFTANLARYRERFPEERLMVIALEDLKTHGDAIMNDVARFLSITSAPTLLRDNSASVPKSAGVANAMRAYIKHQGVAKTAVRALVPDGLRRGVRRRLLRANAKPADKPAFDEEARALLREAFAGERETLSALLGRDFTWPSFR